MNSAATFPAQLPFNLIPGLSDAAETILAVMNGRQITTALPASDQQHLPCNMSQETRSIPVHDCESALTKLKGFFVQQKVTLNKTEAEGLTALKTEYQNSPGLMLEHYGALGANPGTSIEQVYDRIKNSSDETRKSILAICYLCARATTIANDDDLDIVNKLLPGTDLSIQEFDANLNSLFGYAQEIELLAGINRETKSTAASIIDFPKNYPWVTLRTLLVGSNALMTVENIRSMLKNMDMIVGTNPVATALFLINTGFTITNTSNFVRGLHSGRQQTSLNSFQFGYDGGTLSHILITGLTSLFPAGHFRAAFLLLSLVLHSVLTVADAHAQRKAAERAIVQHPLFLHNNQEI